MKKNKVTDQQHQHISDENLLCTLNADEVAAMEKRRQNRIDGKSKTYDWTTAKIIITGKKINGL